MTTNKLFLNFFDRKKVQEKSVIDWLLLMIDGIIVAISFAFQSITVIVFQLTTTVELQWLEHWWLVYHGCFELILESLRKNLIAADLE